MKYEPIEDRLRRRLLEMPNGCVEFQGFRLNGYGVIGKPRSRGTLRTHRVAWELVNGPVPDGLYVCHHCDNRACCNVEHLFLGTHAENMADMKAKGRADRVKKGKGSLNGGAKLSEADVQTIRARFAAGEYQKDIARDYGITQPAVSFVVTGRNWSHLPPEKVDAS